MGQQSGNPVTPYTKELLGLSVTHSSSLSLFTDFHIQTKYLSSLYLCLASRRMRRQSGKPVTHITKQPSASLSLVYLYFIFQVFEFSLSFKISLFKIVVKSISVSFFKITF